MISMYVLCRRLSNGGKNVLLPPRVFQSQQIYTGDKLEPNHLTFVVHSLRTLSKNTCNSAVIHPVVILGWDQYRLGPTLIWLIRKLHLIDQCSNCAVCSGQTRHTTYYYCETFLEQPVLHPNSHFEQYTIL